MAKLIFTVEGEHSDLEWIRTHIDGAIQDIIAESEEENRLDDPVEYGWEYDD